MERTQSQWEKIKEIRFVLMKEILPTATCQFCRIDCEDVGPHKNSGQKFHLSPPKKWATMDSLGLASHTSRHHPGILRHYK